MLAQTYVGIDGSNNITTALCTYAITPISVLTQTQLVLNFRRWSKQPMHWWLAQSRSSLYITPWSFRHGETCKIKRPRIAFRFFLSATVWRRILTCFYWDYFGCSCHHSSTPLWLGMNLKRAVTWHWRRYTDIDCHMIYTPVLYSSLNALTAGMRKTPLLHYSTSERCALDYMTSGVA